MHKEDVAIDKKLAKFPPVSRARQFEMVEVKCRVCGRTETVSPSLVFEGLERYKCNNCSTSAG
jgi:transposase-like protein